MLFIYWQLLRDHQNNIWEDKVRKYVFLRYCILIENQIDDNWLAQFYSTGKNLIQSFQSINKALPGIQEIDYRVHQCLL